MKGWRDLSLKKRQRIRVGFRTLIGIIFICPVLMAVVFSFVPNENLYGLPDLSTILGNLTLENYRWIFQNIPIFSYLKNTLLSCLVVVLAQTAIGCLAAYAFAFYKFRGKEILFRLLLVAMMIPGEVCIICNFITVRNMGLMNTLAGLTITSLVSCHAVFMLRQSYLTLPREMREATLLDGCGELRYMIQFAVPLSVPTICALAITSFISVFNSYLWPLLISRSTDMYTIQVGMSLLADAEVPTYGRGMAGAVLCMVIPVIIFVFFQNYMIKGMTNGAVKG